MKALCGFPQGARLSRACPVETLVTRLVRLTVFGRGFDSLQLHHTHLWGCQGFDGYAMSERRAGSVAHVKGGQTTNANTASVAKNTGKVLAFAPRAQKAAPAGAFALAA